MIYLYIHVLFAPLAHGFKSGRVFISGPYSCLLFSICTSGIYRLQCNTCSKVYIGQSGRAIITRFKEHLRYIKNNDPQSANFTTDLLFKGPGKTYV